MLVYTGVIEVLVNMLMYYIEREKESELPLFLYILNSL